MDIYQSIQSAIELQNLKLKYPFTIDCWNLSSPGIVGEVEERIRKHHPPDVIEQVFLAKVRRYIKNKLNL